MKLADQFKALNAAMEAAQSQIDNAEKLLRLSSEGLALEGTENHNIQVQIEMLLAKAKQGKNIDAEIKAFSKVISTKFPKE